MERAKVSISVRYGGGQGFLQCKVWMGPRFLAVWGMEVAKVSNSERYGGGQDFYHCEVLGGSFLTVWGMEGAKVSNSVKYGWGQGFIQEPVKSLLMNTSLQMKLFRSPLPPSPRFWIIQIWYAGYSGAGSLYYTDTCMIYDIFRIWVFILLYTDMYVQCTRYSENESLLCTEVKYQIFRVESLYYYLQIWYTRLSWAIFFIRNFIPDIQEISLSYLSYT